MKTDKVEIQLSKKTTAKIFPGGVFVVSKMKMFCFINNDQTKQMDILNQET